MATKGCNIYLEDDDYYTTLKSWKKINHLIPKDKIIWEACMLNSHNSKSPEYLKSLGNKIIFDKKMDCLTETPDNFDMIITNPPFSLEIKKKILKRFVDLDKPFIIILNSINLHAKYFREIFGENIKYLQVIYPDCKLNFDKFIDGQLLEMKKCPFYCIYLSYKMNFENLNLWL